MIFETKDCNPDILMVSLWYRQTFVNRYVAWLVVPVLIGRFVLTLEKKRYINIYTRGPLR